MKTVVFNPDRIGRADAINGRTIARWLARIALAPLLGAATTVGVSWIAAALINPISGTPSSLLEGPSRRIGNDFDATAAGCSLSWWTQGPATLLVWKTHSESWGLGYEPFEIGPAPAWSIRHDWEAAKAIESKSKWVMFSRGTVSEGRGFVSELASGWPKPALVARFCGAPASAYSRFGCTSGIPLPAWSVPRKPGGGWSGMTFKNWPDFQPRALPLSPYWPGFLTDTAVFAAPWLAILVIVPATRRWIRSRRGVCTACGYPRRGLPTDAPCPECGTTNHLKPSSP